jgi:Tfp pilus assembly protein PilE
MNKQRLPAFTIMEVVITMLLAAIVMGITYRAYEIISKSYLSYQQKNDEIAELVQLDKLIRRDFERAGEIRKTPDGLALTSAQQSIQYEFEPDYIIRRSTIIDTFQVQVSDVNMRFEKQLVTDDAFTGGEKGLMDELRFTLFVKEQKIPYHYFKIYSSANLIERNPDAIH